MLALAGLLVAGCGDGGGGGSTARIPSAAELAGTYDLTTKLQGEEIAVGVGIAGEVVDGSGVLFVELTAPAASLQGPFKPDGTAQLEGTNLGSDAREFLAATVRAEERDGAYRITGKFTGPFEANTAFRMERAVGADLSGSSGHYRVTLASSPSDCRCETSILFDLTVPPSGEGFATATTESDGHGNVVGLVSRAGVDVSPSGRFTLSAHYALAETQMCLGASGAGQCTLTLAGILPRDATTSAPLTFLLQDELTTNVGFGAGGATIVRLSD
jgi:hypothetical protein